MLSSLFTGLKAKLSLVIGAIIAALLGFIRIQSLRHQKLEKRYAKERQDRMRELYEKKDDAVDAMVEGLRSESDPVTRGHFDNGADG